MVDNLNQFHARGARHTEGVMQEAIGAAAVVALSGLVVLVWLTWLAVLPTIGLLWLAGWL